MIPSIPIKALIIIHILISLNFRNSCTCRDLGKIDYWQFAKYQLFFKGKVLEAQKEELTKKINFEIIEIYKGDYLKDTVQINSHIDEEGCGISPFLNESWLIFAYREDGAYKTTRYTRAKRINYTIEEDRKSIKEEIQFLKATGGP